MKTISKTVNAHFFYAYPQILLISLFIFYFSLLFVQRHRNEKPHRKTDYKKYNRRKNLFYENDEQDYYRYSYTKFNEFSKTKQCKQS